MVLDIIKSALGNVFRKKARSVITILGIVIGICSVVIIGSIGRIGTTSVEGELSNLGVAGVALMVNQNVEGVVLTGEELEQVRGLDFVQQAVPVLPAYSTVTYHGQNQECVIWGIDAGEKQVFPLELLHGRLLRQEDVAQGRNICVVDEFFAKTAYGRSNIVGKNVTIRLGDREDQFEVIGVVASGGAITQSLLSNYVPYFLYVPYPVMQRSGSYPGFQQIAVKFAGDTAGQRQEMLQKQLVSMVERFSGNHGAYVTENMEQKGNQLTGVLDTVSLVLTLIGGISLLVSGLTIMIVMLSGITERTREIGIKKALGARKRMIGLSFLTEALVLSLVGAIIGCVLGTAIVYAGCLIVGMPFAVDWGLLGLCVVFALFVGMVFGVYPAIKAARLSPVEAFAIE